LSGTAKGIKPDLVIVSNAWTSLEGTGQTKSVAENEGKNDEKNKAVFECVADRPISNHNSNISELSERKDEQIAVS
jgi:hypothetical protein